MMKIYTLVEEVDSRPHGHYTETIATSTKKKAIFNKAAKLSRKELESKSSWQDKIYWVNIFDNTTGKRLDHLEFDSNGRREGTFGKIVRSRGSRDEKVVGTWYK